MLVFIVSYAIQLIYVIIGFICTSKHLYKFQKISAHSIVQDFNNYKETKLEIMKLIDKLNIENPGILAEFKEYLSLEKQNLIINILSFLKGYRMLVYLV